MNVSIQIIIVLTVVSLFSGLSLVYVDQYAEPLIKINEKKATEAAIFMVLPEVKNIKKLESGESVIYKGFNQNGKFVGYAFVAEGNGYQGVIKMMVGINPSLEKLTGIEVIESVETPGLGAKITKDNFKKQFKGISVSPEINYIKGKKPINPNEIQAITGATISSRSVVKILNINIKKIKEIIGGKVNPTTGEDKNE